MPRFELIEGTSKKFWQIEIDGATFTTTHGRIGTNGSVLKKSWPDTDTAAKEYDKLVHEKTRKGYSLVGGGKVAVLSSSNKPKPKRVKPEPKSNAPITIGAFNASLAKRIDANPDDSDAWAVYADWLQSQGDPRGELAVAQEGLRSKPKDKSLLDAEKKLLKDYGDAIVGANIAKYMCASGKKEIAGSTAKMLLDPAYRDDDNQRPIHAQWRGGFLSEAFVGQAGYGWHPFGASEDDNDVNSEDISVPKLLLELLKSPATRFMTSLRLGSPEDDAEDGEADFRPLLRKLVGHDALPRLRSLYIGDVAQLQSEVSCIYIGDLSKLYPSLKNLRTLTLRCGNVKLGAIALPELRELTIITTGLDKKNVAAVCAAKWPKLEKLELWFGASGYGGNTKMKDLAPIFEGKAFPKLKHLGLRNSELSNDIAAAIPTAKILKQLTSLDLSKGTMSEVGVKSLLLGKAALAHLTHIDLSQNFLGKAAKLATSLAKQVRTIPQRASDDDERYVALDE